ncbi:MAG: hypothetical protein IJL58_05275 [Bacteroidales bacterium]|nr:hypothetical protein [Bacteroidales bacterium]
MKELTDETFDDLGYLGALGWTDSDIAGWLDTTEETLALIMAGGTPETLDPMECSRIADAVRHGRLEKRASIEIKVAKMAARGDLAALDEYSKIVRDKSFSISKLDLFGGAEKEGSFEKIQEYIAGGSRGTLPDKEQVYIQLLNLIYSLDGQYGKRRTIKFLTSPPFGLTYQRASEVYAEAVELFYCNRKISKEAMRNKIADQFDTLYIAARDSAKTTRDYEVAANILVNKAKALQLDKDDPVKLPAEIYQPVYRLLSVTPESIGLPSANRDELERQIDGVLAPDSVKRRLKIDAGIMDLDIVKYLEDAKEES